MGCTRPVAYSWAPTLTMQKMANLLLSPVSCMWSRGLTTGDPDIRQCHCSVAKVTLLHHGAAMPSPDLVQLEPQHVHPKLAQQKVLVDFQQLPLSFTCGKKLFPGEKKLKEAHNKLLVSTLQTDSSISIRGRGRVYLKLQSD